jgi:uncharacterized protein
LTRRLLTSALLLATLACAHGAPAEPQAVDTRAWQAAIRNADLPRIRALLRLGAGVDARDQRGLTALMRVSAMAKSLLAIELLKAGSDPQATDPRQKPVIAYAIDADSSEVVESLLQHGLAVDQSYAAGYTALMWAAESGRYQALQSLLKHGARKDLRNSAGLTALDLARQAQQGDVIALLQDAP